MYQDLQINRLRSLVTVVDTGGFHRAAIALRVTQPAISQQIRHLDRLIDSPVFLSTGRDLVLSIQGEKLLAYARRLVALNDEAIDRFVDSPLSPVPSQGGFIVGITEQLSDILPNVLRQAAVLPNWRLSVRTGNDSALCREVSAGRMDLAILLKQSAPPTVREFHHLGRMRLGWFGHVSSDGTATPLVLFKEPCPFRGSVTDAFDEAQLNWRVGYECSDLMSLRSAVKADLGVACLVANSDELWGITPARSHRLPSLPDPANVTMVVGKDGPTGRELRIMRDVFRRALAGYPFEASDSRP